MKITKGRLRRIIKEERAKLLAEAQVSPATAHMSNMDAGDMVIDQALTIFPQAIVDEEFGEIVVDTGLPTHELDALYPEWISLWPEAQVGEGGLIYTGITV